MRRAAITCMFVAAGVTARVTGWLLERLDKR